MRRLPATVMAATVAGVLLVPTEASSAAKLQRVTRCAALNAVYPYGVGLVGAVDRVKGGGPGITNFRADSALYRPQPRTLDRDKDGVACEKNPDF